MSCSAAVPCSDDAYCDYADDRCGTGDETGTCRPRPHACSGGSAAQRCGCDGHLHEEDGSTEFNSCFVNLAGADLAVDGRCDMPGWLSCGSQLVEPGVEGFYCVTFPKRKGPEAQHALYLLDPSACDGIVTCDCFAAFVAAHPDEAPCASPTCAPDAAGHAMVTCP
ncbi:MAG TPA: hypothetical protein VHB21_01555 [Minicystis sp.]|nr:hypothetical protein [Minicystis sp.]